MNAKQLHKRSGAIADSIVFHTQTRAEVLEIVIKIAALEPQHALRFGCVVPVEVERLVRELAPVRLRESE